MTEPTTSRAVSYYRVPGDAYDDFMVKCRHAGARQRVSWMAQAAMPDLPSEVWKSLRRHVKEIGGCLCDDLDTAIPA